MDGKESIKKVAWSPTSLRLFSNLLLPFRVIYRSHVYYLVYVIALAYGVQYSVDFGLDQYDLWLEQFVEEHTLSLRVWSLMGSLGKTLVYLLVAPVIIAIIAAPIRHIFLFNKIRPTILAQELPHGVLNTLQSMVIMAKRLFLGLIPVFVLSGGYFYWAAESDKQSLPAVFIVCGAIVCAVIIIHQIPVMFAPFMAATSGFNPFFCVNHAPDILAHGRMKIALLASACVGLIYFFAREVIPRLPEEHRELALYSIAVFWIWYFMSHILHLLLIKTLRYQAGEFSQGPAAPPPPSDGPVFVDNIDIS
jgi:hypothetical protein